jgi:hypothetical protein
VVSQTPAPANQPGVIDRTIEGVKQSLQGNLAPLVGAVAGPQNAEEHAIAAIGNVSPLGPQGTLAAYRAGKAIVDSAKNMLSAPREHFQQAKQDFITAAQDLHNKNYWSMVRNLAEATADISGMIPGAPSELANRERELIEGTKPGGNLATPLAKDVTDLATMYAGEKAPGVAEKVGKLAEKVAPESMNSLLRANKQANYLYGKNPGKAFIDEGIKIPKSAITVGGQLENLHGQLETAQDNLSSQLKTALSEPSVAAKRIDIVPTVRDAVGDAKKFILKQTGLDVPRYTKALNDLEDSILTRYDDEGNPTGKITGTKLSPAEVADVKRSLGKNTQWRVLPTDPDIQLKSYLNSVRKKIYGQLADTVEQVAPGANVHELNQRLANSIEAQGLLEKRIAYEHGTGGYAAAARKAEFWGGLATALFSPEPITKSLGASAVADRVVRSIPGKMATAKILNAAGESLRSGAAQGAARAAGAAALAAPAIGETQKSGEE